MILYIIFLGRDHHFATITMSIFPKKHDDENLITLDKSPENIANTSLITPRKLNILKNAVESTLQRGPKIGCPVSYFLYAK